MRLITTEFTQHIGKLAFVVPSEKLLSSVDHVKLDPSDEHHARKQLRIRTTLFIILVTLLALLSIYENVMVKLLMMFLIIISSWYFLKSHLRIKYDIADGMKCVQEFTWQDASSIRNEMLTKSVLLEGAYGRVRIKDSSGFSSLKDHDRIRVSYLPLSNLVLRWERL